MRLDFRIASQESTDFRTPTGGLFARYVCVRGCQMFDDSVGWSSVLSRFMSRIGVRSDFRRPLAVQHQRHRVCYRRCHGLVLRPMALLANLFKLQAPVHTAPCALFATETAEQTCEAAALPRFKTLVGVLFGVRGCC